MSYNPRSYRKFIASITTVAVVAAGAAASASAATKSFSDVNDSFWAAKEIYSLVEKGIIKGYEDNTYKPNQPIIRGHVANLLTAALNLEVPSNLKAFDDVKENSEFAKGAAATKAAGIFEGYNNKFDGKGVLTREQMASVLVRSFDLKTVVNAEDVSFKDFDNISPDHQKDVKVLAQNGITLGNTDGTFDPKGAVTRASFAVLLDRALKVLDKDTFEFSLLHTNDTHSYTDKVAKRATAIKEARVKKPDSLLIDAGDVMSGTIYFNEFKGKAELEFMNAIGYDVMTFGNHEFDLGLSEDGHKALAEFVKGAKFPFVSTNVDFSKDSLFKDVNKGGYTDKAEDGNIYHGLIKEVNGEKIGIFGLTTMETKDISSPEKVEFLNYLDKANEAVKAFENAGVDKIVAISHLGYDDTPAIDNDKELAKLVDGIDIIVGGHTHTKLEEAVLVNKDEDGKEKEPTVIVQAYQYNDFLGTLDVEFDENGVIVGYAGELISIADKQEDKETAAMLTKYSERVDEIKNIETGGVAVNELPAPRSSDGSVSVRNSEVALGNLIADGMLDKAKEFNAKTVIAVHNGGSIRASIDKGPITLGEILTVMPFGNTLATMTLKGSDILDALEHSVSQAPKESGGFLHISGMKYTYDSSKPAGSRVVEVQVEETEGTFVPLDLAKDYVVTTSIFTARGGDGYAPFKKAFEDGRVTDLGFADWENLRDYVVKLKDVDPKVEGRIVDLAK